MLSQIVQAIGDAIGSIIAFIPDLLAFLAILAIGYFVAKALQKLTDVVLERVGFDKLVERGGVKRALARTQYDVSDLMARGVYWVAMLFVLQLAFGVFGPNAISAILTRLIAYLPNVFAAALILVVASGVAAIVRDMIDAATGTMRYGRWIANASAVSIIVIAAFAAASQLGIAPAIVNGLFYAALAAIVGVIVVAVGGSGVMPLREYWSRGLYQVEKQMPQITEEAKQAPERVKERAEERKEQAKEQAGQPKEIPVRFQRSPVGSQQGGGQGQGDSAPRR